MAKAKKSLSLLSPKNDFVFKQIFGDSKNTRPLRSFLQATLKLPEELFAGLTIIDPNLNPEFEGDKACAFDVRIELRSGRMLDVEIQTIHAKDMSNRLQYYTAKMIAGQLKAGEGYSGLTQVITIVIADFVMWPENRLYHHGFLLYEPDARIMYPNSLEIHTLELPKIPMADDGSKLYNWLKFVSAKKQEEFELLAEKDTAMAEAYAKLKVLSADELTRLRAEYREKAIRDEEARRLFAAEDGFARGEARGEARSRKNIARKLLLRHTPVADVAEITGLSEAEVKRLAKPRGRRQS